MQNVSKHPLHAISKPQESLKFAAHDTGITGRVLRDGFPHPGKSRKRMDDIDPIKFDIVFWR